MLLDFILHDLKKLLEIFHLIITSTYIQQKFGCNICHCNVSSKHYFKPEFISDVLRTITPSVNYLECGLFSLSIKKIHIYICLQSANTDIT